MLEIYLVGSLFVFLYVMYTGVLSNKEIILFTIIWPWGILKLLEEYIIFYCEDYYNKLELPEGLDNFMTNLGIKIRSWFI